MESMNDFRSMICTNTTTFGDLFQVVGFGSSNLKQTLCTWHE